MILELFNRFQTLAEGQRPPVAPGEPLREVAPAANVQQVQARVEQRLPDGRYRVLAQGQRFDVELPAPAEPGDNVRITVTQTNASSTALQTPPSARSELSEGGRLVARLAAQLPDLRTPGTISAAQPLLPDAVVDARAAAALLRDQVGLSGLFYESHQAKWLTGERDEQQLLREPQGRLDTAQVQRQPMPSADAIVAGPSTRDAQPALQLPPGATPLVQQQINALEARHIVWTGEVWPGQPMRWEIEDGEKREAASTEPAAHVWRTRVDLNLPRLGAVTALFTLGPGGVGLRLQAQSPATDLMFAERLSELRSSLTSAGLDVAEIARSAHART